MRISRKASTRSLVASVALLVGSIGIFLTAAIAIAQMHPSTPQIQASATSRSRALLGMPAVLNKNNVYSADSSNNFSPVTRGDRPLIYVPNSASDTVTEIDPFTMKVVRTFISGRNPQHIVPSYDLRTLWVTNDLGNSLTPIDPKTGLAGPNVHVADPYNLYFTPDGKRAIVVAEALHQLDFRDPHTMKLLNALHVPCSGIDHIDFSADGTYFIATCEFSGTLIKVNTATETIVGTLRLPLSNAMPQDIKLSPNGKIFYVADMMANGVYKIDGNRFLITGFIPTGKGAHGLYISRNDQSMYVSNRLEGSVSVINLQTQKVRTKWIIPGGGSPDMGNVSANGKVLWLSGRYNSEVYAMNTITGKLIARIPVGSGPHGLCVWPQPGRYSLGHTGILR